MKTIPILFLSIISILNSAHAQVNVPLPLKAECTVNQYDGHRWHKIQDQTVNLLEPAFTQSSSTKAMTLVFENPEGGSVRVYAVFSYFPGYMVSSSIRVSLSNSSLYMADGNSVELSKLAQSCGPNSSPGIESACDESKVYFGYGQNQKAFYVSCGFVK